MKAKYIHRGLSTVPEEAYLPVIVATGTRQSGKTTPFRNLYPDE